MPEQALSATQPPLVLRSAISRRCLSGHGWIILSDVFYRYSRRPGVGTPITQSSVTPTSRRVPRRSPRTLCPAEVLQGPKTKPTRPLPPVLRGMLRRHCSLSETEDVCALVFYASPRISASTTFAPPTCDRKMAVGKATLSRQLGWTWKGYDTWTHMHQRHTPRRILSKSGGSMEAFPCYVCQAAIFSPYESSRCVSMPL